MIHIRISKLNRQGIAHLVIPVFTFVLLFAAIGSYVMLRSSYAVTAGSYMFRSGMSGKCLDVWHDGPANGTKVDLYPCNKTAAQQWNVNNDGTIENANGKCLDNWKQRSLNGNAIKVYTCNSRDPAEKWDAVGGILKNPQTGKCVDDPAFSTSWGKPLELWSCNGGANQEWVSHALGSKIWLLESGGFNQMEHVGASQQLVEKVFSNSRTYAYQYFRQGAGTPSSPIGLLTFASGSYQVIWQAFNDGILPGKYKAVLYDNERWSSTPVDEQQHPAYYEMLTGQLAHRHGLIVIATPAPDLMWSVGRPKDSYVAFLQAGYAADAARYADIYDIQAQTKEENLPYYTWFISAAAKQAREANPRIRVVIGIRTNPGNTALYNAYKAANDVGDGFWLNINGIPDPAVYLLRHI